MDINNSFVLLDKPANLISHEATSFAKKLVGASKAGHHGTLDPKVSGVLPIAFGKATKLLAFLSRLDKVYIGAVEFKEEKTEKEILQIFSKLTGKVRQVPPLFSAVAKKQRVREIYSLNLLEVQGKMALFKAHVEAGTYIRVLCQDMGGEMIDLRRISAGPFNENECYSLEDLREASYLFSKGESSFLESMLLSPEEIFEKLSFPKALISKETAYKFIRGVPLYSKDMEFYDHFFNNDYVAVYCGKKLVAIGLAEIKSKHLGENSEAKAIKPMRPNITKTELDGLNE